MEPTDFLCEQNFEFFHLLPEHQQNYIKSNSKTLFIQAVDKFLEELHKKTNDTTLLCHYLQAINNHLILRVLEVDNDKIGVLLTECLHLFFDSRYNWQIKTLITNVIDLCKLDLIHDYKIHIDWDYVLDNLIEASNISSDYNKFTDVFFNTGEDESMDSLSYYMSNEEFDRLLPRLLKELMTNVDCRVMMPYLFFLVIFKPYYYYNHDLMQYVLSQLKPNSLLYQTVLLPIIFRLLESLLIPLYSEKRYASPLSSVPFEEDKEVDWDEYIPCIYECFRLDSQILSDSPYFVYFGTTSQNEYYAYFPFTIVSLISISTEKNPFIGYNYFYKLIYSLSSIDASMSHQSVLLMKSLTALYVDNYYNKLHNVNYTDEKMLPTEKHISIIEQLTNYWINLLYVNSRFSCDSVAVLSYIGAIEPQLLLKHLYPAYETLQNEESKDNEKIFDVMNCITNTIVNCLAAMDVEKDLYPFVKTCLKYIDSNTPQQGEIVIQYLHDLFSVIPETTQFTTVFYSIDDRYEWLLNLVKVLIKYMFHAVAPVSAHDNIEYLLLLFCPLYDDYIYKQMANTFIEEVRNIPDQEPKAALLNTIVALNPTPFINASSVIISSLFSMFENQTPSFENRKSLIAIYMKYTNNILSSFNQLFFYRYVILPVPIYKSFMHVCACLSYINNDDINAYIREFASVTLLKHLTPHLAYETFPVWNSVPETCDISDKNKILHDAANYIYDPKDDKYSFIPFNENLYSLFDIVINTFYIQPLERMKQDMAQNSTNLESWIYCAIQLSFLRPLFPLIFPLHASENSSLIYAPIAKLRDTYKDLSHPLSFILTLLTYLQDKDCNNDVFHHLIQAMASYFKGNNCVTEVTTGEPDTSAGIYHTKMCEKYEKIRALSVGPKYQFLRCLIDQMKSIQNYISFTENDIYNQPNTICYDVIKQLFYIPSINPHILLNTYFGSVSPVLQSAITQSVISYDQISSLIFDILPTIQKQDILVYYILTFTKLTIFDTPSFIQSYPILKLFLNPLQYISDSAESSLVTYDTEDINSSVEATLSTICSDIHFSYPFLQWDEQCLQEFMSFYTNLLDSSLNETRKLLLLHIFTFQFIQAPKSMCLNESLIPTIHTFVITALRSSLSITNYLGFALLHECIYRCPQYFDYFVQYIKNEHAENLIFNSFYLVILINTSMLSPSLSIIYSLYNSRLSYVNNNVYYPASLEVGVNYTHAVFLSKAIASDPEYFLPIVFNEINQKLLCNDETIKSSIAYATIVYYSALPILLTLPKSSPLYADYLVVRQKVQIENVSGNSNGFHLFILTNPIDNVITWIRDYCEMIQTIDTPSLLVKIYSIFRLVLFWISSCMLPKYDHAIYYLNRKNREETCEEYKVKQEELTLSILNVLPSIKEIKSSALLKIIAALYFAAYYCNKEESRIQKALNDFCNEAFDVIREEMNGQDNNRPFLLPILTDSYEDLTFLDETIYSYNTQILDFTLQSISLKTMYIANSRLTLLPFVSSPSDIRRYNSYLRDAMTQYYGDEKVTNVLISEIVIIMVVSSIFMSEDEIQKNIKVIEEELFSPYDSTRSLILQQLSLYYSVLYPKIISRKVKHFERLLNGKKLTEEQKQMDPEVLKDGAIRGLCCILNTNSTYHDYIKEVINVFVKQSPIPAKYHKIIDPCLQGLLKEAEHYNIKLKDVLTEEEFDFVSYATTSLSYFS